MSESPTEPVGEEERLGAAQEACERVLRYLKNGAPVEAGLELSAVLKHLVPVLVEYRDADWVSARAALKYLKEAINAQEHPV